MKTKRKISRLSDQKGVTIVIVAGLTVMFVAFIALSVDVAHLYVARNELQNAADAGALAGTRYLYLEDGSAINPAANQVAFRGATENKSERVDVEVNDPTSNSGDVQRGHWSFATHTFTPNSSTSAVDLFGVSSAELDANPDFINAVRVRTHRVNTKVASFFARIVGFTGFNESAEAVAYLGFAGSVQPEEIDQPIAICEQSILNDDDQYSCNIGRMTNSGSDAATFNTAAWTNYSQDAEEYEDECHQANTPEVTGFVCGNGNPNPLNFGEPMGLSGGAIDNAARDLRTCFLDRVDDSEPWNLTLPVVDCGDANNPVNCQVPLVGVVNLDIVWVSDQFDVDTENPSASGENKLEMEGFPEEIAGFWTPQGCAGDPFPRSCAWNEFVSEAGFNLENVQDLPATYDNRSIYFKPSCEKHEPTGSSGGKNFSVLAKTPVLVD